jgi:hypothetical protein
MGIILEGIDWRHDSNLETLWSQLAAVVFGTLELESPGAVIIAFYVKMLCEQV